PHATDRADGLTLHGVYIGAPLRCAPPGNKPTTGQLENCSSYLDEEVRILRPRVVISLGGIGWNAALKTLKNSGRPWPGPKPRFAHGAEVGIGDVHLLGCYHVSQQNTFTGRLTEPMIDAVLRRATAIAASRPMC
ncbi:MAG: uracil-DNA glycosylase, partial [Planctomycetota bacterium]|nr:uracil-DNA glycosylase [Planctomycetota bacterium]